MRVIRTEIFFDPREVKSPVSPFAKETPGVGFYFLSDRRIDRPYFDRHSDNIGDILFHDSIQLKSSMDDREFSAFIDISLRGVGFNIFKGDEYANNELHKYNILNNDIVKNIISQDFIVENSPPDGFPVRELFKYGPAVGLGSCIGYFGLQYPILFISVPGGIVLVGAALGISKALDSGLQKSLQRKLERWLK